MEEVERVCDLVGIIDHGRLISEGTTRELLATIEGENRILVHATGNLGAFAHAVNEIHCVREVRAVLEGIQVVASDAGAALAGIVNAAQCHGIVISSLDVSEPDLEQVFLHLTGRELRD
jgi:ABC-2 type transport system ATP-binding protein